MEKAKIFQSIVKGSNFFTPIVDSYYTVGNHIVELSCSEKDNWRGRYDKIINGITFKGKYGVTVITNEGDGWKRSTELDKLCDSRDEAIYKNKRLINQFGSNLKEAAYHRKVRIRAIKRGGTIVEGTVLEIKSKYPINVFENESSKEVSK